MKLVEEEDDKHSVMVSCAVLRGACRAALTSKDYPNGSCGDLYYSLLEYYDGNHESIVEVKNGRKGIGAGDFRKDPQKKD